MNIFNKIGYWYLVVLSLFYSSSRVFIASVFHVLTGADPDISFGGP